MTFDRIALHLAKHGAKSSQLTHGQEWRAYADAAMAAVAEMEAKDDSVLDLLQNPEGPGD